MNQIDQQPAQNITMITLPALNRYPILLLVIMGQMVSMSQNMK